MARSFVAASSQSLLAATTPITATPLTVACWYTLTSTATGSARTLISISSQADDNNFFRLAANDGVNGRIDAETKGSASTFQSTYTLPGFAVNTWFHAAAVFASPTSRIAYGDGVAGTENTTSQTPAGLSTISVGVLKRTGHVHYHDGLLKLPAIWDVALTADEMAQLATGVWPGKIRPESLVGFWPLWGDDSPEPDFAAGARQLTVTGATKSDSGPPVQPMSSMWWGSCADVSVAGGGGNRRRRILLGAA